MESVIMIVLIAVLFTALYTDLRSSRIPNALTLTTMGGGLIAHGYVAGFEGILFSLGGLATGLAVFLCAYASAGIGAGDVKLMGAVGALVGPYGALVSGLLAMLVGGVYALAAIGYQWGIAGTGRQMTYAVRGVISCGERGPESPKLPFHLRYGVAIVGGTLLFLAGFHPFGG